MSRRSRRWEQLQARWARGERLSADEERERLAFAAFDPAARRELELLAELRERAAREGEAVSPTLIESVLEAVQGRPRLRLVTSPPDDSGAGFAPPRRSWLPHALVAAALLLIAAFGVVLTLRPSAAPRPAAGALPVKHPLPKPAMRAVLVLAAGDVEVDGRRAAVGQELLHEGQRLTTRTGKACLTIDSNVDVCLAEDSSVQLQWLAAQNIRLQVDSGTAIASLAHRPPGSTFSLVTDEVSAAARGTTFAARREQGQSEVIVLDGAVDVVRGGDERLRVAAHSRVRLRSGVRALEQSRTDSDEEARLLALRSSHKLWQGGGDVGALHLFAASPAALRASIDDVAPQLLPLQTFVRAGRHRLTWQDSAGAAIHSSWVEVVAGETQRVEPAVPSVLPSARAQPAELQSQAALLSAARREVARARPREALALYEKLRASYPHGAEARTVLVTMGKLELQLGRQERALRHFDAYLEHGGALAPEALAGKIRTLRALGRRAQERAAIQQYLARHPNGLEAPLFRERLRDLGPP
jgi:hypothetical protein